MNGYRICGKYIQWNVTHKNEIMSFAATQVDLEIIILSEVSQKDADNYNIILLICEV